MIELREGERKPELLIDGKRVSYGQLPGGSYYLSDYAFDWTDDLMELARRYVSYRGRVEKAHAEKANKQGERGGK